MSVNLHGVKNHNNTVILTAVRTSNLTHKGVNCCLSIHESVEVENHCSVQDQKILLRGKMIKLHKTYIYMKGYL
jgi:hypothetical protein